MGGLVGGVGVVDCIMVVCKDLVRMVAQEMVMGLGLIHCSVKEFS